MFGVETVAPAATAAEMRQMLRELQRDAILFVLPVLSVAGAVLFLSDQWFRDPLQATVPGTVLLVWPIVVWVLRRRSYLASAWALVVGVSLLDFAVAVWVGSTAPFYLLALTAGAAALYVSAAAGALTATVCTGVVLLAPSGPVPVELAHRLIAVTGIWATLGLVWLTSQPLMTALQWSWSSHIQSRFLLDQARDDQVRLKQTLADLADANSQLTRLNRLAHGLRQSAEDARRAKEQFVANVSHELRTPLNMVLGFSEMILQAPQTYGANVPPALLADLSVVHRNTEHLASLIDDVLDLSQIEAGRVALTKERVVFGDIVESAVDAVRPLFESKGLSLQTDVQADLPPILCDRTRVREILLNLLSNAGRFTESGSVGLRAWREEDGITTSVADTGPGITAEHLDRIFQPFQQLDGSIRSRYGGTGLGLSISKSFVELHGGRMWLESEVGTGTTFYFRLPVDLPDAAGDGVSRWFSPYWQYEGRTRSSLSPAPNVRPRYLVLESGSALQRLLARYMDGAEIQPVASLDDASREAARLPARALLVNNAAVDQTLRQLAKASPMPAGTPAIACFVPDVSDAADELGVATYLIKPIERAALLGALDGLQLHGRTVFVVDDDPEALRLFWRMLSSADGYRVITASSGREALAILREQHPDAMLLDLIMPEMDGFQVLAAKGADPELTDIPVIVTTARDPMGQPIVSGALAVTRGGGLSVPLLLAGIEGLARLFGPPDQADNPVSPETAPG